MSFPYNNASSHPNNISLIFLLSLSLSLPPSPNISSSFYFIFILFFPYSSHIYTAAVVEHFPMPQPSKFPVSAEQANSIIYQNLLTYEQRILT